MRRRGFTLIELIVVIVILGVLAALAVPNFRSTQRKSEQSTDRQAMLGLTKSIEGNRAFDRTPALTAAVLSSAVGDLTGPTGAPMTVNTANDGEATATSVGVRMTSDSSSAGLAWSHQNRCVFSLISRVTKPIIWNGRSSEPCRGSVALFGPAPGVDFTGPAKPYTPVTDQAAWNGAPWGPSTVISGWTDTSARWVNHGGSTVHSPGVYTYRLDINVPANTTWQIEASGDDQVELFLDGTLILTGTAWNSTWTTTRPVTAGDHVLTAAVRNWGTVANPTALILSITDQATGTVVSRTGVAPWTSNGFSN